MALSNKHQQFINEYIACYFNGTKAYRRVYPKSSKESARREASRLLTNVDIAEEIKQRISEKAMSADEVLARLAEQARGDITEFIRDSDGELIISLVDTAGNIKPTTRLIKKFSIHQCTMRTAKNSTTEVSTWAVEMYSAQAALKLLGAHHGLFNRESSTSDDGEAIAWDRAALD